MDDARQKALALYAQVKETHESVFVNMQRAKEAVRELQNLEQIVDVIAVLKKSDELLKDTKSQVAALTAKLQEIACKLYMQHGASNIGEPIRTEWVTGTPDIRVKPSLPSFKLNPTMFIAMCNDLGYPLEAGDAEMFRPHYPSVMTYLSKLQEQCKPMPAWVDTNRSGSEFGVKCLWKRDVEIDDLI